MQISFSKPYLRALLAACAAVLTLSYSYLAFRAYRAAHHAAENTEAGLHRALALEPGDADYHDRLGRYYFHVHQDAAHATDEYQMAVRLNPHNAYYWLDLASGYEVLDHPREQARAIAAAYEAGPYTPDVLWTVANLHLAEGNVDKAWPLLRRILAWSEGANSTQMNATLSLAWRATHDVDLLLERVVPPRTNVLVALLHMLARIGEIESAGTVWKRIVELGRPMDPHFAFGYLDGLLQSNQFDAAKSVWTEMGKLNPEFRAYVPTTELIVDGGFEQELLNAGLDWRVHPPASVTVSPDTTEFHSGTRSLRIAFDGQAPADAGVLQYVPVDPGKHYVFRGFVRAEDVWTQSGPRFLVRDAQTGTQYFLSDDVLGSAYWRERTGHFTTGPGTRLLAISVVRTPSNSRIKGTIWIDDVSLREE